MMVTLNFETKQIFGDQELLNFLLQYYNDKIVALVIVPKGSADNGRYYVVSYYDDNDITYICKNIKLLCKIFKQNCIACKMESSDITLKALISDKSILEDYREFHDEFFTTLLQARQLWAEGKAIGVSLV